MSHLRHFMLATHVSSPTQCVDELKEYPETKVKFVIPHSRHTLYENIRKELLAVKFGLWANFNSTDYTFNRD